MAEAFIWGKVNQTKTDIPIFIETNVKKMYLNSDSKFSILTMNGIFKSMETEFQTSYYWYIIPTSKLTTKTFIEYQGVIDICYSKIILEEDTDKDNKTIEETNYFNFFEYFYNEKKEYIFVSTLLKEDVVYEVSPKNNEIERTIYSTFYEYYLYKKNEIKETIQISSDGYLKLPIIELIENPEQKLLKKNYKNIYDKKHENSFEIIERIGKGAFGVVNKVENKSSELFAIKRIQIKG